MHLHLESSLSLPGRADKPNEDAFGLAHRAAWIIDGATGQGADVYVAGPGETDAFWLAQKMREVFARLSGTFLSGPEFYAQARDIVLSEFNTQARKIPEADYAWPSAAVSRMALNGDRLVCDSLGDCTILLRRKDGRIERHGGDPVHATCDAQAVSELVRLRQTGEISPDKEPLAARSRLLPLIRANRNRANTVGGYGSFTLSKPIAAGLVRTTVFSAAAEFTHALLMTDGFYALVEDYHSVTDEKLVSDAMEKGIDVLAQRLREVEDADPRGLTYPRFKKSDDATAVLVRFSP